MVASIQCFGSIVIDRDNNTRDKHIKRFFLVGLVLFFTSSCLKTSVPDNQEIEVGKIFDSLVKSVKDNDEDGVCKLTCKFIVRVAQDAACSKDPSAFSTVDALFGIGMDPNYQKLTTKLRASKKLGENLIFQEQLKWADSLNEQDKLPVLEEGEYCHPRSEWKKRRRDALAKLRASK